MVDSFAPPISSLMARLNDSPTEIELLNFIIQHAEESHARSFDDLFAWWAFGSARNPYFVEAGCWDPSYLNYTYLLETRLEWDGLLVEPSPRWSEAITEQRRAKLVRRAIVTEADTRRFVEFANSGESSATLRGAGRANFYTKPVAVETVTLRSLILPLRDQALFLSLDVEGQEGVLVREILADLPSTMAISVEVLDPAERQVLSQAMLREGFSLLAPELSHYNLWFLRDPSRDMSVATSAQDSIVGWKQ